MAFMFPTASYHGSKITDTYSTNPGIPVGSIRGYDHPTYGPQIYRFVKNGAGATLSKGLGAMVKDSATDWTINKSGAAIPGCRMGGVAQWDVADTYFAWILADGLGLYQSNGSTSANTGQKPVASGQFADGVVGTDDMPVFALPANAVASTNTLGLVKCL